ncbi:MAG: integration host factor subunit beta [Deltaproteobacteria bacterium]|nr:integration host factor subunit beta [Deltaproteobacteria bacterium]
MTKSQLIERVFEKVNNLSRRDVEVMVNVILEGMIESLKRGEKIEIRGFGSFRVKERRPRRGRNPKTGEGIDVPQKRVPFFKVGKELKARVEKGGL